MEYHNFLLGCTWFILCSGLIKNVYELLVMSLWTYRLGLLIRLVIGAFAIVYLWNNGVWH